MKRSGLLISSVVLAMIILFFYQKRNKSTKVVGEFASNPSVLSIEKESIALVTGASGGIGSATARMLHSLGAYVILSGRNIGKLNNLKDELGGNCSVKVCDLLDIDSCKKLIDDIEKDFGRLDILICNGGGPIGTILGKEDEKKDPYNNFSLVSKCNLESTFVLNKKALELMKKKGNGGRVINVSSILALCGGVGLDLVDYGAVKAGINGLTKGFARTYGKYNITVNVVCPGWIDTEMTSDVPMVDKTLYNIINPCKRAGNAAEVAQLICYLASKQASYTNGASFVIDGGLITH